MEAVEYVGGGVEESVWQERSEGYGSLSLVIIWFLGKKWNAAPIAAA